MIKVSWVLSILPYMLLVFVDGSGVCRVGYIEIVLVGKPIDPDLVQIRKHADILLSLGGLLPVGRPTID